jgi:hypothetical protein
MHAVNPFRQSEIPGGKTGRDGSGVFRDAETD